MATTSTPAPSINEIEQQIAKLQAALNAARNKAFLAAEKAYHLAENRLAAATTKLSALEAKPSTTVAAQARLEAAKNDVSIKTADAEAAKAVFAVAQLEKEIENLVAQELEHLGDPSKIKRTKKEKKADKKAEKKAAKKLKKEAEEEKLAAKKEKKKIAKNEKKAKKALNAEVPGDDAVELSEQAAPAEAPVNTEELVILEVVVVEEVSSVEESSIEHEVDNLAPSTEVISSEAITEVAEPALNNADATPESTEAEPKPSL